MVQGPYRYRIGIIINPITRLKVTIASCYQTYEWQNPNVEHPLPAGAPDHHQIVAAADDDVQKKRGQAAADDERYYYYYYYYSSYAFHPPPARPQEE